MAIAQKLAGVDVKDFGKVLAEVSINELMEEANSRFNSKVRLGCKIMGIEPPSGVCFPNYGDKNTIDCDHCKRVLSNCRHVNGRCLDCEHEEFATVDGNCMYCVFEGELIEVDMDDFPYILDMAYSASRQGRQDALAGEKVLNYNLTGMPSNKALLKHYLAGYNDAKCQIKPIAEALQQ